MNFDKSKKTLLCCDASRHGFGGVLSQHQEDGTLRTVAYVSRRLKDTEGKWSVSEIELFSMVYTVTYFSPFFAWSAFYIFLI